MSTVISVISSHSSLLFSLLSVNFLAFSHSSACSVVSSDFWHNGHLVSVLSLLCLQFACRVCILVLGAFFVASCGAVWGGRGGDSLLFLRSYSLVLTKFWILVFPKLFSNS